MDAAAIPLRDIHLPAPPGPWPPAPGWWVVALVCLALAGYAAWRLRRRPRLRLRTVAGQEFARIRGEYAAHRDAARLARDLSVLMRRVALTRLPREQAAGVHGDAWLALLDGLAGAPAFSQGPGRALALAPYRPAGDLDAEALLAACERVVAALPRESRP